MRMLDEIFVDICRIRIAIEAESLRLEMRIRKLRLSRLINTNRIFIHECELKSFRGRAHETSVSSF